MSEINEIEQFNEKVDFNLVPKYTLEELKQYDGIVNSKVFVSIKGIIFDVTINTNSYGPGKAYHKLTAKDVTRLLGFNRFDLTQEAGDSRLNTTWYADDLDEKQLDIVDKWIVFFKKRYYIVGKTIFPTE